MTSTPTTYPEARREPSMVVASQQQLVDLVGVDLEPSEWHAIDQTRIDAFASVTSDFQWIHVDSARAADGPFGTAIAHGYLTLSLVPLLLAEVIDFDRQCTMTMNYGINKARFPSPLPVGSDIRVHGGVSSAEEADAGTQVVFTVLVEARGNVKPVLVADLVWIVRFTEEESG